MDRAEAGRDESAAVGTTSLSILTLLETQRFVENIINYLKIDNNIL